MFAAVLMLFFTVAVPEERMNAANAVKKYTCDGLNYLVDTGTMTAVLVSSDTEKITKLTIPDSITSIKDNAFSGCSLLANVNYTGTLEQWLAISFDNINSNPCNNSADLYIDRKKNKNRYHPEEHNKHR